jgi:hypothetical protein
MLSPSGVQAMLDSKVLYHGTTLSRARQIELEGFTAQPPGSEIVRLAEIHDVDPGELRDFMEKGNRFSVLPERTDDCYFTKSFKNAASYAQRAPEITWEALISIYQMKVPSVGENWNQSNELHWWVFLQRIDDPPSVLTVEPPAGKLFTGSPIDLSCEPPLAASAVLEVTEVPVILDFPLVFYMAGYGDSPKDQTKFIDEVESGGWGVVRTGERGEAYWQWNDLKEVMPQERLKKLMQVRI